MHGQNGRCARSDRPRLAVLDELTTGLDPKARRETWGLISGLIAEDLIDEYRQFVNPVILGNGTPYFPPLAKPLELRLAESRTLSSRVVYLRYQRIR